MTGLVVGFRFQISCQDMAMGGQHTLSSKWLSGSVLVGEFNGSVAQSVNRLSSNREVSRSIPSCVTGHGVSIVDAQLRIPLDLCSPTVHSAKCSRNRV